MQIKDAGLTLIAFGVISLFTSFNASTLSAVEGAKASEAALLNAQAFGEKLVVNYPSTPFRHDYEGSVTLQVEVTTEGRAKNCRILESSGHSIIDAWACKGTERYARFSPAVDVKGTAIEGLWSETFTLRLGDPALKCGDCFPFESEG